MAVSVDKGLLLNGTSVNSADELDPTVPSFSVVTAHPSNTERVTGFSLGATGNDKLGVGGHDSLASYAYSHSTGAWTARNPLVASGTDNGMACLLSDDGYHFGGETDETAVQKNSIATDTWTDVATLSADKEQGSAMRQPSDPLVCNVYGASPASTNNLLFNASTLSDTTATVHSLALYLHHGANTTNMATAGDYGYTYGGQSGSDTATTRYDFDADTWTSVGAVSYGAGACGASAPSDQIWCCGGGANLQTTAQMDTSAETWSAGTSLAGTARSSLGCVGFTVYALDDEANFSHWEGWQSETGYSQAQNQTGDAIRWMGPGLNLIYVHGGVGSGGAADTTWSYDPIAGSWTTSLATSTSTANRGAGLSNGTNLWTTQGQQGSANQRYSPVADSWTGSTAITSARMSPAYSDGFDNRAVVSHGGDVPGNSSQDDCYSFFFSTETWATETVASTNRNNCTGFSDQDDTHWAIGGGATTSTTQKYSVSSDSWEAGTDVGEARTTSEACSLHLTQRGYVVGGATNPKGLESTEFASDAWVAHVDTTNNHDTTQLVPWNNNLYVVSGSSGTNVEMFSHATDTWTAADAVSAYRNDSRGGAHDQHIQNNAQRVDFHSGTLLMSQLTNNTTYYCHLWAHDRFYTLS